MSTWKLQKLCYYSQALHLAWTEKSIFGEDFEAWANGSVCPELFHAHQGKFSVNINDFAKGTPENLTEDEKDSVNAVLRDYGSMEPYDLREQMHNEEPWKNTREWAKSRTIITKESMENITEVYRYGAGKCIGG